MKKRLRNLIVLAVFSIWLLGAIPNAAIVQAQDYSRCARLSDVAEKIRCNSCIGNRDVWTAVGCVHTNPSSFVRDMFTLGIGVGGGIAFLIIVMAGFRISTATGDPKKLQSGKDMLSAAIQGLLLILFSIFILRFLSYDVLRIPGFW